MTPAFYLRVSTRSQDFPSQLHAIREHCRRQRWPAPGKANLFTEKESGAKAKRRELDRLLQACRDGKYDTIITYRGDRLGRSFEYMANVYAELRAARIRVIGVADGIDTEKDTPTTRAFQRMLATIAELQREMIVENTKAGLAAARKRGQSLGRPRSKDAKIAQALALKAKGKTFTEILRVTQLSRGYLSEILNGKWKAKL
jgi:DNA invertase Pin-like site-specific DNA recombinase